MKPARQSPTSPENCARTPGEIRLEQTDDGEDLLVLCEEIGGRDYETRIYAHEGGLYEVFTAAELEFAPAAGQRIAEVEALALTVEENLVGIAVTVDGEEYASSVALKG